MIVPTRPRREIVCAARGTTATCRRRGSSQRRLAVVQGTGQGDWQGPDPIVASVRTPPRPAPRAPAEGGSTYLAVGKRSCTLRAGFVAAERNPSYRPSLMGQRDGHRNRLKQVVRVLALTVVTSALPFTAAFAGVTGTDGPGGTVSVGASDGGTSAGAPGSVGNGGSGGAESSASNGGSQWACTSTSLLLNDLGGFPPGGATPGGWYSVTCINRVTGASSTQTEWITTQSTTGPTNTPAVAPRSVALQAEKFAAPSSAGSAIQSGGFIGRQPGYLAVDRPVDVACDVGHSLGRNGQRHRGGHA